MVKAVAAASGLGAGEVKATAEVHAFFQQSMETDWQFCWRLAGMHNYEFVVEDTKFHFRPRSVAAAVATVDWGGNLLAFKPRMSGMGQAKSVRVANHDPKARRELVGEAQSPQLVGSAPAVTGRNRVVGALQGGTVVVADRVTTTQNEARSLAQSRLDRMAASFMEADGKAVGDPRIRAGKTITVEKVGRFSGNYVLTQTHHTFRGGNQYTTGFIISGTGHTITELLRTGNGGVGAAHADWATSLVIGIVTNNNDPDKMGRVRVKFPALGDNIEGWWARVATLNAGTERGMYMLPQIEDEVVCGFEHGDPRRPFVLGSLFNGKTKIPADLHDAQGRKAMFGVKSDEKVHVESEQAMTFRSKKEMKVEVQNANGSGNFVLDAKGGAEHKAVQSVKQTAGQSFTIEAAQAVTIKGTASVTVESQGSLTLKGAAIDIQATGPVNVKGAIINLG
jgi:Type VI secretion system/phage-baseplate injector OB domain